MTHYRIVEKANPLALHALCDTKNGADYWLTVLAPSYCAKGYFMDKTLTPDSFMIVPPDHAIKGNP